MNLIRVANETIGITKQGWYTAPSGENIRLETGNDRTVYAVDLYPPEETDEIIARADEIRSAKKTDRKCRFYVEDADSFEAARKLSSPLVMNFANAHHAGGGFRHGAKAQEEALCRTSTLYASIRNRKARAMYLYNRRNVSSVYSDYFLISPNVIVFRDRRLAFLETPYKVAVVTIASPNRNGAAVLTSQKKLDQAMTDRLRKMLYTAADQGYRDLVLGAWGCGAFGNDPKKVAGYFHKLFFGENLAEMFDNVVFAILGKGKNYQAFKDVFKEKEDEL